MQIIAFPAFEMARGVQFLPGHTQQTCVCVCVCVCVCACVCVCVCIHMNVYVYKYIYTHKHTHTHIYIHMIASPAAVSACVCVYTCCYSRNGAYWSPTLARSHKTNICVCECVCVYVHMYMLIYINIYLHTQTHTHTHTHTSYRISLQKWQKWRVQESHFCQVSHIHTSQLAALTAAIENAMGWLRLVGSLNL